MEKLIYNDEFIKVYMESGQVFIESYKKGFQVNNLLSVMSEYPEIEITKFNSIITAVNSPPKSPQLFGKIRERISIEIKDNDLKATIVFYVSKKELELSQRDTLLKEVYEQLNEKGINFGIRTDILSGPLEPGKSYIVAEGLPPIKGEDCIITMYQVQETKPVVVEGSGQKVNFYELTLINKVLEGDWLGEKTEPTEGKPGKTIKGAIIPNVPGKNKSLLYDTNSVEEVKEQGKTVLRAKISGAVNYTNGKITVSNYLEIEGDVDFKTGNIDFDGHVSIKGSVTEGFSVKATKDIEINGSFGLGNVKEIESSEGSIFIKGGIASKGQSIIKAAKNVYTKFIDNSSVIAGESLHIGFACTNSNVEAKELIIDSGNGQIVGGVVKVEYRVVAPIIGSELERRTIIEVKGFNRDKIQSELENLVKNIKKLKDDQQALKQLLAGVDRSKLDETQKKIYNKDAIKLAKIKSDIKSMEELRINLSSYLKTKGEGEVAAIKKIYPNCLIILKGRHYETTSTSKAITIYLSGGEIKTT